MGKHANSPIWDRFKPLATAPEEWEPPEPSVVLTRDERDQIESDMYWDRKDEKEPT